MVARRKLNPGQKGTKKFLDQYGDQLVCVRYRYDREQRKRFTTVEIIVEEGGWSPPEPVRVGLRVGLQEVALQRRIKQAGGTWNREQQVWDINYDQAVKLGLQDRIVQTEVSNIRHLAMSNTGHPKVSNIRHRWLILDTLPSGEFMLGAVGADTTGNARKSGEEKHPAPAVIEASLSRGNADSRMRQD